MYSKQWLFMRMPGKHLLTRNTQVVLVILFLVALSAVRVFTIHAATKNWDFTNSGEYTYDASKINFTGTVAQISYQSSNWYNASWSKRKAITVNNTGNSSTLANYQVKVIVTYDADMQPDFDDIRFTDTNGTTLLDYWLESKSDSSTATFWVEVPTITGSSNKNIYVYYGNADATNASNGENTFLFFDDTFAHINNEPTGLENAANPLTTPTYDGSGQAVHPDIVYFDTPWNGYTYWMSMQPYPNGNDDYENNSILASNDGQTWVVPDGMTNPMDSKPSPLAAHGADGDLFYDSASDQLWAYYIETGGGTTYLKRRTSSNGTTWSSETNILSVPDYQFVSPSIQKLGSTYYMWYIDTGAAGCSATSTTLRYRTSSDGVTWSSASTASLSQEGTVVWHVDVIYMESLNEYWMLFPAYPAGSNCGYADLYFAKSADGINWTTYPRKVLANSASNFDSRAIYRSTFLYNEDTDLFRVWYSGFNSTQWRMAYAERDFSEFFADIQQQIPNNIWTTNYGTWVAEDGTLKGTLGTSTPNIYRAITAGTNLQDYILEFKGRHGAGEFNRVIGGFRQFSTSSYFFFDTLTNGRGFYTNGSTFNSFATSGYFGDQDFTEWHTYGVSVNGTSGSVNIKLTLDGVTALNNVVYSGTSNNSGKIALGGYNGDVYFDEVRVRQYTATEPSVSVGSETSNTYDTSNPSIISSTQNFLSVSGFSETATKNGGEIKYQISNDAGSTWYWYDSGWTTTSSGYTEANTASDINTNIPTFPEGDRQFRFKAFLSSDGTQLVQLDTVSLTYSNDTTAPSTTLTALNPDPTADTTPTLTGTVTDSESNVSSVEFQVNGVGGSWSNCVATDGSFDELSETFSCTVGSILNDGSHTLYVRATDALSNTTQAGSYATDTFSIDSTSPTFTEVNSSSSSTGSTITWATNEQSSSKIEYGLTNTYGNTTNETDTSPRVTSHSVTLTSLKPCTLYHYRVKSKDSLENEGTSSNQYFVTSGCTGSASVLASDTEDISTATGGTADLIESDTGLTLTIPTGFSNSDAHFQIKRLTKSSVITAAATPNNRTLVGNYVYDLKAFTNINTQLTSFDKSITVQINYKDGDLNDLQESNLQIYRWDSSRWNLLDDCVISTATNTISCTTSAFSVFGLFADTNTDTESSSNSQSSSSQTATSTAMSDRCQDSVGTQAPWLYGAIPQTSNSVLLYFTQASNPVDRYAIQYGLASNEYLYGADAIPVELDSRMTYLVNDLKPNTTYYFKVRGGNGCMPGSWSNEVAVTTHAILVKQHLKITSSNLSVESVVNSDTTLDKHDADTEQEKDAEKIIIEDDYKVKVKVLDEDNNPVKGAQVTLHSKIQQATTDENGIASFENVEHGNHRLIIAYQGYTGEQSLSLSGDVTEFSLEVTIKNQNILLSPVYIWTVAILGVIITILLILYLKKQTPNRH